MQNTNTENITASSAFSSKLKGILLPIPTPFTETGDVDDRALVANIMPHGQLIGAISISRTTMDTARITGALSGAGLFASLGMGPAYVAIVGLYIIATALTLCIVAPGKPHRAGDAASEVLRRSPMRDLKEGVVYCWTTPGMRAALWIGSRGYGSSMAGPMRKVSAGERNGALHWRISRPRRHSFNPVCCNAHRFGSPSHPI